MTSELLSSTMTEAPNPLSLSSLSHSAYSFQCPAPSASDPSSQCGFFDNDSSTISNHILRSHPGKVKSSFAIRRAFPDLDDNTCPHCKIIFQRVNKHIPACYHRLNTDPAMPTALNSGRESKQRSTTLTPLIRPRSHSFSGPSHRNAPLTASSVEAGAAFDPQPAADHPLPTARPRVWESPPPSIQARFTDINRPGLIAYTQTTDLDKKARIIAGLLAMPNKLLQKVRGHAGKSLSSITRHITKPGAAEAVFAEFRHIRPSSAAAARSVDVDISVDGSAGQRNGETAGEAGIGIVVHDHKTGSDHRVRHSAYLGTGTNNSAEVSAIIYALELYKTSPHLLLRIHSDSSFARGAAGTDSVQRKHARLIHHLRDLIRNRNPRPLFVTVKAHAGNADNEEADKLAGKARTERKPPPPPGSFLIPPSRPTLPIPPAPPPVLSNGTLPHLAALPRDAQLNHLLLPVSSNAPVTSSTTATSLRRRPGASEDDGERAGGTSIDHEESRVIVRPQPLSAPPSTAPPRATPTPPVAVQKLPAPIDAATALSTRVRRATTHTRQGNIAAAVQALARPQLPQLTKERLEHLVSLHPQRDPNEFIEAPPTFSLAMPPAVDEATIVKLIQECDNGKATGPSNLTAAHLRVLAADPDCLRGICDIIGDVIDGNLAPAAVDLLTGAVSVATDKGGDLVRPLAVPEIIYKIAGLLLLEAIDSSIPLLFPKIQLGCGVKNGIEIAIHRTQLALELGGAGSDTIVLCLDFRNAFNERSRAVIAKALFNAPSTSRLWRFFMMAYGNRSSHLGVYQRGQLIYNFINSQGVKQGCPVASFLYALSVQSLYTATVAGDDQLEAVAIADDFTITGPSDRVIAALRRLIALCAADGPTLNLTKCKALWAYSTAHPNYAAFLAIMTELRIPILYDSIPLLGASVGLGMHRAAHCMTAANSHDQFFKAISHPDMPVQIGLLLLRQSGLPRFTYLTRVTPPVVIRAAAERFDELVTNLVASICGLPPPSSHPNIYLAITSPLSQDGMGFPPHTRASPAAHFASWANSAHDITYGCTRALPLAIPTAIRNTDIHFHLDDTYSVLVAAGIDPAAKGNKQYFPGSFDEFWSFYAGKHAVKPNLQRHLRTIIDNQYHLRHQLILPVTEAAPAVDPTQPAPPNTTSLLFTTNPTSHGTNINDHHLRLALRHRYRVPPANHLPTTCDCGKTLAADAAHWHSCVKNRKLGVYDRHEVIVTELLAHARRANVIVHRTPPVRDVKGQRTQPDITMHTHVGPILIDVSICCTYAATNMSSQDPIITRERQKTKKYAATAADNCALFIPFVLDSVGRFGDGACRIIDLIITEHTNNALRPDPNLHDKITRGIAIQLQRGNGLVDAAALRYHPQSRLRPQHPLQRQPPCPPPIKHDTMRRPPASPHLIPSLRGTPTPSSSSTAAYTDPNTWPSSGAPESKEEQPQPGVGPGSSDDDHKRGSAAAISWAFSPSSSSSPLSAHIDVLPHTTPQSIVDSSSSSSAPSFTLLGPARVPFARPPPPQPDG
jgi:ribonuclease HI